MPDMKDWARDSLQPDCAMREKIATVSKMAIGRPVPDPNDSFIANGYARRRVAAGLFTH
jgi:hypothetical protein